MMSNDANYDTVFQLCHSSTMIEDNEASIASLAEALLRLSAADRASQWQRLADDYRAQLTSLGHSADYADVKIAWLRKDLSAALIRLDHPEQESGVSTIKQWRRIAASIALAPPEKRMELIEFSAREYMKALEAGGYSAEERFEYVKDLLSVLAAELPALDYANDTPGNA